MLAKSLDLANPIPSKLSLPGPVEYANRGHLDGEQDDPTPAPTGTPSKPITPVVVKPVVIEGNGPAAPTPTTTTSTSSSTDSMSESSSSYFDTVSTWFTNLKSTLGTTVLYGGLAFGGLLIAKKLFFGKKKKQKQISNF
jgi:hypothetical protein